MVRYCDDFVVCFEKEEEAKLFMEELKLRLAKFKLEIAEEKSSVVKFGRATVDAPERLVADICVEASWSLRLLRSERQS